MHPAVTLLSMIGQISVGEIFFNAENTVITNKYKEMLQPHLHEELDILVAGSNALVRITGGIGLVGLLASPVLPWLVKSGGSYITLMAAALIGHQVKDFVGTTKREKEGEFGIAGVAATQDVTAEQKKLRAHLQGLPELMRAKRQEFKDDLKFWKGYKNSEMIELLRDYPMLVAKCLFENAVASLDSIIYLAKFVLPVAALPWAGVSVGPVALIGGSAIASVVLLALSKPTSKALSRYKTLSLGAGAFLLSSGIEMMTGDASSLFSLFSQSGATELFKTLVRPDTLGPVLSGAAAFCGVNFVLPHVFTQVRAGVTKLFSERVYTLDSPVSVIDPVNEPITDLAARAAAVRDKRMGSRFLHVGSEFFNGAVAALGVAAVTLLPVQKHAQPVVHGEAAPVQTFSAVAGGMPKVEVAQAPPQFPGHRFLVLPADMFVPEQAQGSFESKLAVTPPVAPVRAPETVAVAHEMSSADACRVLAEHFRKAPRVRATCVADVAAAEALVERVTGQPYHLNVEQAVQAYFAPLCTATQAAKELGFDLAARAKAWEIPAKKLRQTQANCKGHLAEARKVLGDRVFAAARGHAVQGRFLPALAQ